MLLGSILAGVLAVPIGSLLNRLIVREPSYLITDPADLPEGADESLLDELDVVPALDAVPVVALVRPGTWWRRWFPVTELAAAALAVLAVQRVGTVAELVPVLFLAGTLLTLSAIDLRVYRLPDRLNLPSMAIGLALIVAVSLYREEPGSTLGALAGGCTYAGTLFLAHLAYPRGMGWGDVKLAWLMGFYLGWAGWEDGPLLDQYLTVLQFVLTGAALGSMVGVVVGGAYALIRRTTKTVFPYGPALAAGCLFVVLWAEF